ncbi:hypothetical protein ARC20_01830 [Stenotrophomonas panacihumi]|uniref:Uncharacterized protein n=1 Tax=Stenotrophomonas panacihumi TaxID=676599 RepID=A0A0Q9ZZQ6_9GAMM|nr:hypothetical protein [Stenotrophomonas panacihumi]KRG38422.1 hypothetical protein ARC20_01830 [Stenotrophomonas panacihumi]PTN54320.1 hypothetical protein C9J98_10790 [Stenotrophomonas panacihumi]
MRVLSKQDIAAVAGGKLECSVGIPSGVSCKGSPGDFRNAGMRLWALSATNPVSGPGIVMRIYRRLS